MHVKEPLDIFLSHDWPLGITEYGDWQKLIRVKTHFEEEVMLTTLRDCLMSKLNAVASFFPL
jgi:lariat debranching enzyme